MSTIFHYIPKNVHIQQVFMHKKAEYTPITAKKNLYVVIHYNDFKIVSYAQIF